MSKILTVTLALLLLSELAFCLALYVNSENKFEELLYVAGLTPILAVIYVIFDKYSNFLYILYLMILVWMISSALRYWLFYFSDGWYAQTWPVQDIWIICLVKSAIQLAPALIAQVLKDRFFGKK